MDELENRLHLFEELLSDNKISFDQEQLLFCEQLLPKLTDDEFEGFFVSGRNEEIVFMLCEGYGEKYQIEVPISIREGVIQSRSSKAVRVFADDALKEEIVPLPWDYFEKKELLFPFDFTRRDVTLQEIGGTGEWALVSKRSIGSKLITYRTFIPEGVSDEDLPKFGELTFRLYVALVWSQKIQYSISGFPAWTNITLTDLLKLCGYEAHEAKGRTFYLAKKSLQTLAYTIYEIKDKKTSKVLEIENIINYKSSLAGQGFYYILNQDHTRLLAALAMGEAGIKYLGYDTGLQLEARKMDPHKKRIFEYLMKLKGLSHRYPITIRKLLIDIAGFKQKEIKRVIAEGSLSKLLFPILDEAVGREYIAAYKYTSEGKNFLQWKVKFTAQRKKRSFLINDELVEEVLSWMTDPLFEERSQIEKKRRYIVGSMRKYGVDKVRMVCEGMRTRGESPDMFWIRIKKIRDVFEDENDAENGGT